jgi:multidrug resistance protein, MATE family
MTAETELNDDGFYGYTTTTQDPGPALLAGTILICIVFNALLPCFVASCRRREKRRKAKVAEDPWAIRHTDDGAIAPIAAPSILSASEMSHSYIRGSGGSQYHRSARAHSVFTTGRTSVVSGRSMTTSLVNQSVVLGMYGRRSRANQHLRRALEKRALQDEAGIKAESFFRFNQTAAPVYFPNDRRMETDDQSVLSKMDTDEVSVKSFTMDAEHEDFIPKQFQCAEDDEDDITCCGANAWWQPKWVITYFDRVVALSEWDLEMIKIMKLTLPFAAQALFSSILSILTVSVIAKFMGTRDVTIYVVVDMIVQFTGEFVGGFNYALTTLCSQAAGANQNKLCGQYVQMAILLYVLFSLPFMFLWWSHTDTVVLWLGFDEESAIIAQEFARVYVFSILVQGVSNTVHALLDVIELENYSTVVGISQEIVTFVTILQVALFFEPGLSDIALIHLGIGLLFLGLNIVFIGIKGWFKPYLSGILGSFSLLNFEAVWLMCKTSLAISMGYILTYGEWECLTIFASFLGPAEVAAWSLLGTLWSAVEALTAAIGDAAEVRCSFLLGCGKPTHAQVSAYKSMLISTIVSLLATSILFILGEDVALWMTGDPVLQRLMIDLLPLLGLGNMMMTVGTTSWTLLGSQGRYRLATSVALGGSWGVTLPLAALASVALNLNLEGQTAAVVLGYMTSGTINACFLFSSNWEAISQGVIDSHCVEDHTNDPSKDTDLSDDKSVSSHKSNTESEIVPADAMNGVQDSLQTP